MRIIKAYNQFFKLIPLTLLVFIFQSNTFAKEKIAPKELEGYQVKFDYENFPEEREIAYQYFKKNYKYFVKEHPLQKKEIGIDVYDISNDGVKEILIYLNNSAYCGSLGCSFEILKPRTSNNRCREYYSIPLDIVTPQDIKILKSSALGYKDLLFLDKIWRWNGNKYEFYK